MSMAAFARDCAARLHHRGCLISPAYTDLAADLREIAVTDLAAVREAERQRHQDLVASLGLGLIDETKPFAFSNGIAVIPIHGFLVNRMAWGSSYATGYNYIQALYQAAVADRDVRAIVYDVNSPGGMGAGAPETGAMLYRREKPSLAIVDSRAYSGGYWLASAAHKIAVTPSGGVGSIGVVAMHVDYSGMLAQDGIKITFIIAGEEKIDGNPYEALTDRARVSIQRDVDRLYAMFAAAVARHRNLSEDAVRATEARIYAPEEAQELGLIDSVASPAEALRQFLAGETPKMADQPAATTDIRTAVEDALRADRQRAAAIRTCAEAEGKRELAEHLATNTDLTVEVARGILASAAKEPTGNGGRNAFTEAMNRDQNPNVGADNPNAGGDGDNTPEARAARILGDYTRATGNKVKAA